MIVFRSLSYKNFLSTGNTETHIQLDANPTTLVIGHNGSGKSTMLDAISFALFGRAHRNIKKQQLINSINRKGALVTVTFAARGNEFKVVRGIKPNVFEVWCNDEMLNQDANSKDYQRILEQNILKLNHKSFHQIVVLGSSSFTPFMQLNTQNRRSVIEDLLDINIFSKMNLLMRDKNSQLKDAATQNQYDIDILRTKIEGERKNILSIQSITDEQKSRKLDYIQEMEDNIAKTEADIALINADIKANEECLAIENEIVGLQDQASQFTQYRTRFNHEMDRLKKDTMFYRDNQSCPTCTQEISPEIKQSKVSSNIERAQTLSDALVKLTEQTNAVNEQVQVLRKQLDEQRDLNNQVTNLNHEISRYLKEIARTNNEIADLGSHSGDVAQANATLQSLQQLLAAQEQERIDLSEKQAYNRVISELIKDTGIKTKIIKQYLPVINKLVNQYLQILDFFVHFNLDENFNETIRSRHRDDFTYDSFSEGEKSRIDLSLLFSWRMVARMKNSVSTNLLILDETFDSSLDQDGVENLMKILYTLEKDTNVFVISHKTNVLEGRFDTTIEFSKRNNFSFKKESS